MLRVLESASRLIMSMIGILISLMVLRVLAFIWESWGMTEWIVSLISNLKAVL